MKASELKPGMRVFYECDDHRGGVNTTVDKIFENGVGLVGVFNGDENRRAIVDFRKVYPHKQGWYDKDPAKNK